MHAWKGVLKVIGITLGFIAVGIGLLFGYFNLPGHAPREDVHLGMTFSSRYATDLGLDWKETYLALLGDMGIRKLRIPVYWDLVEQEPKVTNFTDVDWQLAEAEKVGAEVILVVGQKVPRWPECHIPDWAKNLSADERQRALNLFIAETVERYKEHSVIRMWQVENEPFLPFGICPDFQVDFLNHEIALVKSIDSSRPILVTDSGELSVWYRAASRGDWFGTTLYRDIYSEKVGGYFTYPIGPNFFRFKEWVVRLLTHQTNFMVIELQAEPWASGWVTNVSLEEQFRTMNAEKLQANVDYARSVGFQEIYLWGGEWWYWLKTKQGYPDVWEKGKVLFERYP